jgi:hypothetical protein
MKNDYQMLEKATVKQIFNSLEIVGFGKYSAKDAEIMGDLQAILVRDLSAHGWKADIAKRYLSGSALSDKQRWVLAFELRALIDGGLTASKMRETYEAALGLAA